MLQFQVARNLFISVLISLISSVHGHDFPVVMQKESVHMMLVFTHRQIGTAHRPITHRILFINKIIKAHVGTNHHLSFRIDIMHRSSQPTFHIGQIRQDALELLEADARKFHRHFLIGNGIFAVGIEMDACALVIVQTDISIDASSVCQVNIIPRIQLERTIHQNWIFREKFHADTPSSERRIQAHIHSFFLTGIEILQQKLRLSVADISVQIHLKGFLIRLCRTDDFGEEIQPFVAMLQVNANRIHFQAIGAYMIKVSFAIDSFFGRCVKIHLKLVERNALHHAQIVADGIIMPRRSLETHPRQELSQFFLHDGLGCPLLAGTGSEGIQLTEHIFHIATPLEIHVQVTGTHISLGRIHGGSKPYV